MPQSVPPSPVSMTPAPFTACPSFHPPTSVIVKSVMGGSLEPPPPPEPEPEPMMPPPTPCGPAIVVIDEPVVARLSPVVLPPQAIIIAVTAAAVQKESRILDLPVRSGVISGHPVESFHNRPR
jgi:hypothetical protein